MGVACVVCWRRALWGLFCLVGAKVHVLLCDGIALNNSTVAGL